MTFEGKVVIVTGSTSGIGRAAALEFGRQGAKVTIHGLEVEAQIEKTKSLFAEANIPTENLHSVFGPIEEETIQKRLINETVEKFGKLDILVNNAGMPCPPRSDPNSMESFDAVLAVNLRSVYSLCRLSVEYLMKTKGNIVNVSSMYSLMGTGKLIPYEISKAGVNHLTRTLALLYANMGIRVNAVLPGLTLTNAASNLGVGEEMVERASVDFIQNNIPMKRIAAAAEISAVILFVASDSASFMTGSLVPVDGGTTAGQTFKLNPRGQNLPNNANGAAVPTNVCTESLLKGA